MFRGDFTSNTNHSLRLNNFEGKIGTKDRRSKEFFMVSTGKRTGGGERESAEEDMDRLKPLHNFDLPCLKWGNQKLLRCMKVDSNGDVSVVDRNQSPESGGGSGGYGYVIGTHRRNSEFEKRFRSSDDYYKFSNSSSVKVPAGIGIAGDGEIEATRAKLMFDFQKEVGKMKDAILREGLVDPPLPPAAATTTSNPPAERPWNLRTRRAACKAPRSPFNVVINTGDVSKPNTSPVRNECKYPNLLPTSVADATTSGEKRDRPKFSVSLSRRELEEDFMAMAGRRLPRKPKKRPRFVQKQLDTLFPGLWLSEITADLYKVPDETDTGKR
ncbi:hypothetical protein L1987_79240 [Smallanthus sonchifolius]|uniref:Uncharacterized protein n=1 Tax=Smallanthus sonchifolius TaxID=185202 RepID=A0ACB8ZEX1_9ASTR|nr:hypothetical protein L1987_79240 [Smallanthus sonchifolius]